MLCTYCRRISADASWSYHYPRLSDFQASAETCPICSMLLGLFDPDVLQKAEQYATDPQDYTKVILRARSTQDTEGMKFLSKPIVQDVEIVTRGHYFHSLPFVLNFDGGELPTLAERSC